VYFDWLQTDQFKELIIKENVLPLLALCNLSLDFQEGYQYFRLKKIRNRITHTYLNVNEEFLDDDLIADSQIRESALVNAVNTMLYVTKSAMFYFVSAIRLQGNSENIVSMPAVMQKDIFHR
jgi:hypothetical protein